MNRVNRLLFLIACFSVPSTQTLAADLQPQIDAVMPKVVTWRRDFHENPELSNQEFRTAKIVAEHL